MRAMVRLASGTGPARRGVAATELAVVLPLLVTIVLGCVDFGRFPYSYIAVTNAAMAGAEFGSSNSYTAATQTVWASRVRQAVDDELKNMAGYDSTKLSVTTTVSWESNEFRRITVDVGYPFQTLISWPGIPRNLTLRRLVAMRALY